MSDGAGGIKRITQDEDIASVLNIELSDLTLLKEKITNPSLELVESMKEFCKYDPDPRVLEQIELP